MLLILLLLACCWIPAKGSQHSSAHKRDGSRPHIYYCRSPNMETFTCWWHPLNSSLHGDNITYKLTYTLGNRPPTECPDYVSGGPNSCYFDTDHTEIWQVYCMTLTAHSPRGSFSSNKYCLDVADIVEIDPPFNLTYTLMNVTKEEAGRTVLVSWQYPIAQHVEIGWITLIYELRYRTDSEPNNWKVKKELREPHVKILGLLMGRYEVQVRCRSKNNHLWSKWSSPMTIFITSKHLPAHMWHGLIVLIAIVIIILLTIGLGVSPHGKRIKTFLLPAIPKPLIRGIDPLLLKKGKINEINHHFSSLRDYETRYYSADSVFKVSMDKDASLYLLSSVSGNQQEKVSQVIQNPNATQDQQRHPPDSSNLYCQNSSNSNRESTETTMTPKKKHMEPELLLIPGTGYSMITDSSPTGTSALPTAQEFYSCVHAITTSEMVRLVPCMSDSFKDCPYVQLKEKPQEDTEKLSQLAAYLGKQGAVQAKEIGFCQGEGAQNDYVVSLLPQVTDKS